MLWSFNCYFRHYIKLKTGIDDDEHPTTKVNYPVVRVVRTIHIVNIGANGRNIDATNLVRIMKVAGHVVFPVIANHRVPLNWSIRMCNGTMCKSDRPNWPVSVPCNRLRWQKAVWPPTNNIKIMTPIHTVTVAVIIAVVDIRKIGMFCLIPPFWKF